MASRTHKLTVIREDPGAGHRIRVFREYRDLTQAALAQAAGCKGADIAALEAGRKRFTRALLGRLAKALDFPLSAFAMPAAENAPRAAWSPAALSWSSWLSCSARSNLKPSTPSCCASSPVWWKSKG